MFERLSFYSTSNPCLRTFEKILSDFLRLEYSLTIEVEVDPVVLLGGSDSDTGRVPHTRQPDRVEVVFTREIQIPKYFALTPLVLLTLNLIFVVVSAATI